MNLARNVDLSDKDSCSILIVDDEAPVVERRIRSTVDLRTTDLEYLLTIPSSSTPDRIRIRYLFTGKPVSSQKKLRIVVEDSASLDLEEEYLSEVHGTSANDSLRIQPVIESKTEIDVNSSANLKWVQTFCMSEGEVFSSHSSLQLANSAKAQVCIFVTGGKKQEIRHITQLAGKQSQLTLNACHLGLYREKAVLSLDSNHLVPDTKSEIYIYSVGNDIASSQLNGMIRVAKNAIHSDAQMKIKGLFRSNRSSIESSPQLEILNDDVKVSHGCALSPVDPEQVFYLMSRGIDRDSAESMIVRGFVEQALTGRDQEQKERLKYLLPQGVGAFDE